MLLGQAVMVNWTDVAVEHRHAYYEWHSREHMIGRVAIPGFCRGRRYIASQANRNFLICYEVEHVDVLRSPAYLDKANAPSELKADHAAGEKQLARIGASACVTRHRHRRLRPHFALRCRTWPRTIAGASHYR